MAEPARRPRRAGGVTVGLFSLAGVLALIALLGFQLRGAQAGKAAPRPVLVRRIYQTTVEERVIGARSHGPVSSSSETSAGAEGGPALPATRTS